MSIGEIVDCLMLTCYPKARLMFSGSKSGLNTGDKEARCLVHFGLWISPKRIFFFSHDKDCCHELGERIPETLTWANIQGILAVFLIQAKDKQSPVSLSQDPNSSLTIRQQLETGCKGTQKRLCSLNSTTPLPPRKA